MTYIKKGFKFKAAFNYKQNKEKVSARIVPTPFEVKDNYENYPIIDYNNFSPDYAIIDFKEFVKYARNLNAMTIKLFLNICYMMEPNTNIVKPTSSGMPLLYTSRGTNSGKYYFYECINNLIKANFIDRTNNRGVYVVNHNIFYKGNLNEFAKQYRMFYGKWKDPARNEHGHIEINPRNFIRSEYKSNSEKMQDARQKILDLNIDKFKFVKK